jgi:hypothetical protein
MLKGEAPIPVPLARIAALGDPCLQSAGEGGPDKQSGPAAGFGEVRPAAPVGFSDAADQTLPDDGPPFIRQRCRLLCSKGDLSGDLIADPTDRIIGTSKSFSKLGRTHTHQFAQLDVAVPIKKIGTICFSDPCMRLPNGFRIDS